MRTFEDVLREKNKQIPYLFNREVYDAFSRMRRAAEIDEQTLIRTLELYAEGATKPNRKEVYRAYNRFFKERDRKDVEELRRARDLHFDAQVA